jgi:hypothetical protein
MRRFSIESLKFGEDILSNGEALSLKDKSYIMGVS